jgi:hypothetical protein
MSGLASLSAVIRLLLDCSGASQPDYSGAGEAFYLQTFPRSWASMAAMQALTSTAGLVPVN